MSVLGTISGQVRLDIRQAVAAYAALRAQNQRTVYALRGTGDSFTAAGQRMAVAGGAMVYAFGRVVNAAAEFERKMDYASAVSNTTGEQMQKLSDFALQLGKDTIYSAGEIADGFIELAKAGVSAEQIIGGIGEAMANLGAAGDIPLAQSGQIITSTIQQFDLAARDAIKVTDLLAGAANASIADISDIGVSLKYVGGVANAAGLKFEDTATAISLLAKAGIRGSTAGTSLRQMIVSLGGATGPAREALMELGILTEDGSNKFFTAEGNAKSLSQVFQILQDSTADLTNKQRLMYLRTIFNNRALSAASILTRDGAKGFKAMNKEMSKTTAADVAAERLDNLSGDLEILRGNIETLMIEQGGPFQETLRGWVQGFTKLLQAFSDLDPEVQKGITQTVALTGVTLLAMGAINLIIGSIFRFAAGMLKAIAGAKFLVSWLKNMWTWARLLISVYGGQLVAAIGALSTPILIAVGVIAALVAAFVIAYKKSQTFRDIISSLVGVFSRAASAVANWFKLLATDPGAAWEQLKSGVGEALDFIVAQFKRIPGLIRSALSAAGNAISGWVASAGAWFASLPGRIAGSLAALGASIMAFFASLPGRVGYAIGFLLGFIVRQFALLPARILAVVLAIPTLLLNLFATLAPRIGYMLGFLVGRVVGFFIRLGISMLRLAGKAVLGVINFFRQLPSRVAAFIGSMVSRGIALFNRIKTEGPRLIAQMVTGAINFIRTLPQRAVAFFTRLYTQGREKFNQLRTQAIQIAGKLVTGFVDGIKGLPAQASGIVSDAIAMFKAKVQEAFNAARDFAKGLWEGFKDGLGINSPSLIEKQMWQITDVMDKETKRMAGTTAKIQGISKKLAKTTFSVGDPGAPSSAQEYRRLAVMQGRNQKRAAALAGSVGNRQARNRPTVKLAKGPTSIGGTLRLHPDGYAMIAGIAEEVYDSFDSDNDRRDNM